jgi:hypothetical protein
MKSLHHFRTWTAIGLIAPFIALPDRAAIAADDKVQTACAVAAFTEYNRANVALMQQGVPVMSVESTIAQRRLEEQYCLRAARCIVGDPTNSALAIPFAVAFSKCLRDEALEKSK